MYQQGLLPFRYESEPAELGMTALAGLPAYLELAIVCGLPGSIRRHMGCFSLEKQGLNSISKCLLVNKV